MKKILTILTVLTAILLPTIAPSPAAAESAAFKPAKPVTIIVPYSTGGGTDAIGRLFAKHLGELWGQSVLVDNRTGASGSIGAAIVARAAPDGQTLLLAVSSLALNPALFPKLPFNTRTDFTPITPLAIPVVVMVGSPALAANDLRTFISDARKNPGKLSFASSEPSTQLFGEQVAEAGGVKLLHVPYRGAGQWMSDVVSGTVDSGFASITSAVPYMHGGRMKILGVAADQRSDLLPGVPTFKEQGVVFDTPSWYGLFAPGKTPAATVNAIHRDVLAVLAKPEVKAALSTYGALPGGEAPDAFGRRYENDIVGYAAMVKKLDLHVD